MTESKKNKAEVEQLVKQLLEILFRRISKKPTWIYSGRLPKAIVKQPLTDEAFCETIVIKKGTRRGKEKLHERLKTNKPDDRNNQTESSYCLRTAIDSARQKPAGEASLMG